MTLGTGSAEESCFCSCCGAQMPHFTEDAVVSHNTINQLISESFLTVKGAALFLPRGNSSSPDSSQSITQSRNKHTGDLQQHLQTMFTVLRPEDNIRLAVRLENAYPQSTRYMVVVSTNGRQDTEESVVLGMDFASSDSACTVGLVLPLWSDTLIHLDGDGGFSVSTVSRVHVFKPVSVQAMWSALQSLHKACDVARCHNYYPGSLFLTWVSYYQSRVSSDQFCINEWNAMQDVQSHRADSPVLFTDVPTERERTERLIKTRLREIMMQKDLENVTSKEIRTELEMQMVCNLREFKEFIDNEMIVILGQMDSPTEIFDHVYLGSEWNASNLDELQNSGVHYILNVTREIDNFFPGTFQYHNIRVYDEEATNLLEYWNETYKFITKAKKAGAKCLVHCKMGVSRSASTVIAYAMKEYGWDLATAFDYVKEKRAVTKPNPSFMKQLEEYQGILLASKQRHNKLWRSHSDSDLSDRHEQLCKPASHGLGRSNPLNNNNTTSSPSLHHFLGVAVLQALGAEHQDSASDCHSESTVTTRTSDSHNGVCDSPDAEAGPGCVYRQDPLLLPLPRPRAATVVPEGRMDNSAMLAITLPVAVPHPPPSLHILPPTPEPRRAASRASVWRSSSVPERKPVELSLDLPERSSSEETSPLTLGSSDSDTLDHSLVESASSQEAGGSVPMLVSPLSPTTTFALPLDTSLCPNDDNNNPSVFQTGSALDSPGEAEGSSSLSTDSIDFFSAREKFLGLAHDRRTCTLSEQAQQRTPLSLSLEDPGETATEEEEEPGKSSPHGEDGCDRPSPDKSHHHHDNGISVRHIVTEIESISHPATSLPPSSSATSPSSIPTSSRSSPPSRQDTQQEDRETGEVTHGSSTPPSYPQSPSTPPCDWPAGSVRRATKQLERRLKQELEVAAPQATQRSPIHSPGTEHPPTPFLHSPPAEQTPTPFLHSPGTEHPPTPFLHSPPAEQTPTPFLHSPPAEQTLSSGHRLTQGEATSASAEPKDGDTDAGRDSPRELHRLNSSDMDTLPDPSHSPDHSSTTVPIAINTSTDSHSETQTEAIIIDSSLAASPRPRPQTLSQNLSEPQIQSQASQNTLALNLEGVTAQDLDTDGSQSFDCAPSCGARGRLTRSSQELERIQQTLRELQAFLHEAGGLETGETTAQLEEAHLNQAQGMEQIQGLRGGTDKEAELGKGDFEQASQSLELGQGNRERQGKSFREPAGWQRAMELEARIRQAGLTPPSLMKRSASLAKLDCLELSANDLSDWDLRSSPSSGTPSSNPQEPFPVSPFQGPPHPNSTPDDMWKKQRVLVQVSPIEKTGWSHHSGGPDKPSSPLSSFSPSSHHHHYQEETGEEEDVVANGNSVVAITTARQQGKGHSSRRSRKSSVDKKQRTVTVLYNTM